MTRRRGRRGGAAAVPVERPAAPYAFPAIAVLIVLSGVVAYANSFSNPFILDDQRAIVANEQIRTLWPLSTPLTPPDETPVARRPLVSLSFAVNYAINGLDVRGYHVGNLIIHLFCALALFGVIRRTLELSPLPTPFGAHPATLAAACALIWMLHPIHSELVNYVSQRTTALKNLFYLLTVYCSIRALQPGGYWRAAAILACAGGMASKESMVTAPVLVGLFDRMFVYRSLRDAVRCRSPLYIGLAASWAILIALMMSGGRTTVGFNTGVSGWTYLLNQPAVLLDYLRLAVWPHGFVVDYGVVRAIQVADTFWPLAAIVAFLVGSIAVARRWPRAGFLCLSFFILLAPTSSIVPIASEVGAERRMSLPLAALVILAACAAGSGALTMPAFRSRLPGVPKTVVGRHTRTAMMGVFIICAVLTLLTFLRNREYQSTLTLARTTVERRPHGRAYYTLGNELFEAGRRDEALRYFWRAAPNFAGARFALGTELIADDDVEGGVAQLREFATQMPEHAAVPSARQMMATALASRGDYQEAIAELQLLLAIEPDNPRAHRLIGQLLVRTNTQSGDGLQHLLRAAELQPGDAALHDLLGDVLALQGRFAEAAQQFSRALRIDPMYDPARANLAKLEQLTRAATPR